MVKLTICQWNIWQLFGIYNEQLALSYRHYNEHPLVPINFGQQIMDGIVNIWQSGSVQCKLERIPVRLMTG